MFNYCVEKDIIMENLGFIKNRLRKTCELLNETGVKLQQVDIYKIEKQKLVDTIKQLQEFKNPSDEALNYAANVQNQIDQMEINLRSNIQEIQKLFEKFQEIAITNIKDISELQNKILHEKLLVWKYQQQLGAIGIQNQTPIDLDKVQRWCEELFDLIRESRQQLKRAEQIQTQTLVFNDWTESSNTSTNTNSISTLLEYLTRLLTELINGCFIVEKQPPQVLKLGTKFPSAVTVSLLVCPLNVNRTTPSLSTRIINETQARNYSPLDSFENSGEILNGSTKFNFNKDTKRQTANLMYIQLKTIKRAYRRGCKTNNDCVMEEKFCLLFESDVFIGELKIKVQTMSHAIVVITHGSQEPLAVSTIMWDNAFGEIGRVPFKVPEKIEWVQLAKVLSKKFEQTVGKGLSEDHLQVLKQKTFGYKSLSEFITWSEFCKNHLVSRQFSFWDWLFQALRTIEKKDTHLKDIWKENLLMGFIDRQSVERILSPRQPGTFLLRFSDSILGGITIAWVDEDHRVYFLTPFTFRDLCFTKLANIIKGIEKFKFLYPDIPRDEAFGKFYSNEKTSSAYVPLVQRLPELSQMNTNSVNSTNYCRQNASHKLYLDSSQYYHSAAHQEYSSSNPIVTQSPL